MGGFLTPNLDVGPRFPGRWERVSFDLIVGSHLPIVQSTPCKPIRKRKDRYFHCSFSRVLKMSSSDSDISNDSDSHSYNSEEHYSAVEVEEESETLGACAAPSTWRHSECQ